MCKMYRVTSNCDVDVQIERDVQSGLKGSPSEAEEASRAAGSYYPSTTEYAGRSSRICRNCRPYCRVEIAKQSCKAREVEKVDEYA